MVKYIFWFQRLKYENLQQLSHKYGFFFILFHSCSPNNKIICVIIVTTATCVHLQLLLHVLPLLLQAEAAILLLLQPGLHLVQHLLQLLLLGLQPHPHLLSLGTQLCLRLKLYLQLGSLLHQLQTQKLHS